MLPKDLLRETLDTANVQCWARGRTANALMDLALLLHATGCPLRETR